jgi:hypothetical protein
VDEGKVWLGKLGCNDEFTVDINYMKRVVNKEQVPIY